MNVFNLRDQLVGDYASYVKSLIEIRDQRIREHVAKRLVDHLLWQRTDQPCPTVLDLPAADPRSCHPSMEPQP